MGERSEDAIHPFALQLAKDMQADGVFGIIQLSLRSGGNKGRCERNDRKIKFEHKKLQRGKKSAGLTRGMPLRRNHFRAISIAGL